MSAFGKPVFAASLLDISGATALERWNLTASAETTPDVTHFVTRFPMRDAFGSDSRRASLAFDWQRRVGRDRVAVSAFAFHQGIDLRSAADGAGERFDQRERRSVFGADAGWSATHHLRGMIGTSRLGLRMRSESLAAEGLFGDAGRGTLETLGEDLLRQSGAGLHFDHELHLARGVRAAAGVRLDQYRFGVRSDLPGNSGSASGTRVAPHFSLVAQPVRDLALFATVGRGLRPTDSRMPGAAIDPRSGAPLAGLDPAAAMDTAEAGVRMQLFGVDAKFSAWRAGSDSELMLLAGGNAAWIARPARRHGLQAALRYEPAPWLSLELDAALARARFADGLGEAIPGAARAYGQAGATVRPGRGWNASLFVTSFDSRPSTDDDPLRARSASFVGGRITRAFSKTTRVSLDLFNLLDKRIGTVDYFSATRLWSYPGASDNFLFHPGESRGFRLRLRTTF